MKLHEYQSKALFARYGIPISHGQVATTPDEARAIAADLGRRVVVKAQVLVGGRGKAGGIRLAGTPDEAYEVASKILGMDIKGLTVRQVLVDEASDIRQELYLGVVIDRAARRVTLMASAAGGIEIEEVARKTPEKLTRLQVDPFIGLRDYQARQIAYFLKLPAELVRDFTAILRGLYECFLACDASLAEINPLVVTREGKLLALDGKIVLDDNGLFRHSELASLRAVDEEREAESEARQHGLSYIKLDGEIGCMVNGAGLAMTTMDLVQLFGSQPANFLDIGGGATAERVAAALRIILSDPNVKAVLFNIFGGITRCDEVAKGIVTALGQVPTELPMVIRLVGTNEDEGRAILAEAASASMAKAAPPSVQTSSTLVEAARKAVAAAKGQAYTPLPPSDPILYKPRAKTSRKQRRTS
ncbi:MAG: ADP-forming succinate--CoA ligase subunit beta [Thermoflexales bacterium]|nr:ADP-forming succinate--CoA ligase subunit beta [Thermoflexales bacterium]